MSPRKDRTAVVLDTNVLIAYYLSKKKNSASSKIFQLWRTRRLLQLSVSDEVITEYLGSFKGSECPTCASGGWKRESGAGRP